MLKKTLFYVLSLVLIAIIYQYVFFLVPISAVIVPYILITTYQKYLFKNNTIRIVRSIALALLTVALGCLSHHIGWVIDTGDSNNFFHPDAESRMYLAYFTVINLTGTLIVGLVYLYFNMTNDTYY